METGWTNTAKQYALPSSKGGIKRLEEATFGLHKNIKNNVFDLLFQWENLYFSPKICKF
jgi:hypothetical protein